MEFDGVSISLVTIAGAALFTAFTLQLLIKPLIALKADSEGVLPRWAGLALNTSALVVAIIWALVGLIIESLAWDAPTVAIAVSRGFVAAFLAVFGYEGWKNVRKFQQGE